MQIVIDIPDKVYGLIKYFESALDNDYKTGDDVGAILIKAVLNGTPLPDGAEILTKEAYSDLCTRAADVPDTNVGDLPSARPETHEKRTETHACDCISRQAAEEKLKKVVDEMALIFADIREKNVDDSVCGLCEYDCDHGIDGYANECPGFERNDCFKLKEEYQKEWTDLSDIPSVEPERETGKWIDGKCNRCGANAPFWPMATTYYCSEYCPNCGAKMEVDGNVTEF